MSNIRRVEFRPIGRDHWKTALVARRKPIPPVESAAAMATSRRRSAPRPQRTARRWQTHRPSGASAGALIPHSQTHRAATGCWVRPLLPATGAGASLVSAASRCQRWRDGAKQGGSTAWVTAETAATRTPFRAGDHAPGQGKFSRWRTAIGEAAAWAPAARRASREMRLPALRGSSGGNVSIQRGRLGRACHASASGTGNSGAVLSTATSTGTPIVSVQGQANWNLASGVATGGSDARPAGRRRRPGSDRSPAFATGRLYVKCAQRAAWPQCVRPGHSLGGECRQDLLRQSFNIDVSQFPTTDLTVKFGGSLTDHGTGFLHRRNSRLSTTVSWPWIDAIRQRAAAEAFFAGGPIDLGNVATGATNGITTLEFPSGM